jgi:hypothetical protein
MSVTRVVQWLTRWLKVAGLNLRLGSGRNCFAPQLTTGSLVLVFCDQSQWLARWVGLVTEMWLV